MGRLAHREHTSRKEWSVGVSLSLWALTLGLGGLGALVRWFSVEVSAKPWAAILAVNIVGSALAGGVAAFPGVAGSLPLIAGLCGGLTTFSTVALQLTPGHISRRPLVLISLAAAHCVGGIGACWSAFALVSTALS